MQGCTTIRTAPARLLVTGAFLIVPLAGESARATTVFEYQLTAEVPTVFDLSQEFYNSNPSEIHGRFGQGPEGNWAATTHPAIVRFYLDEQHNNQLTRLEILDYDANLHTFPQPGDQTPDDFNRIRMNVKVNLQSASTAVVLSPNAAITGELSAQINADADHIGTLTASSTVFGNEEQFDVGMMSGALLGSFAGYGGLALPFLSGPDGTVRPMFSTWLTLDGTYISPVSHQQVDYHGVFDMNGYLTFMSSYPEPVPEPRALVSFLAAVGLIGYRWHRRTKNAKKGKPESVEFQGEHPAVLETVH